MGMAYRHAWVLIDDLGAAFRRPVVTATSGGRAGGNAQLTEFGAELVRRFRAMEAATERAIARDLRALARGPGAPRSAAKRR